MGVLYKSIVICTVWICLVYLPGLCSAHGDGEITSFRLTLAGVDQAVNEVNRGVEADVICDVTGNPLPEVDIKKHGNVGQPLGPLSQSDVNRYRVIPNANATQPGRKAYRLTAATNATLWCENHVDAETLQLIVRHQPVPLKAPNVAQKKTGELTVYRSTVYQGDGPLVAMDVQFRPFGENDWNSTGEVTEDPHVIVGLPVGSRYKVRLVLVRPGEGGRGAPGPDINVEMRFIEDNTVSATVVVGSILGVILFGLLVFTILHTVYRSRKESNMYRIATYKLRMGQLTTIPKEITGLRLAFLRLQTGEWKKTGSHRIEEETIAKYVKRIGVDGLVWQFEGIPDEIKYKCKAGRRSYNKPKNRYRDIVPYDYSRVELEILKGIPDSDYINASWVNGYSKSKAFIATQGPSSETVHDFWRMVWEYEPKYIISMASQTEKAKVTCHQYWPDNEKAPFRSGDLRVTLKKKDVMADYTIRTLIVEKTGEELESPYQITHAQYTTWPRGGAPTQSTSLLNLIRTIKLTDIKLTDPEEMAPPIVVHCGSGVDQTGVFVAMYAMLEMMEEEGAVNIREFVAQMREFRCSMVQWVDHYLYIYSSCLEAERCGTTVTRTDQFVTYAESKLGLNSSSQGALYRQEFERLQTLCPNPPPESTETGLLPANEGKNRFSTLVPEDKHRVALTTPLSDKDGNDYINAVYLDSYRRKNGYIVTQAPLANTVTDFWCMISDTDSEVIVMLNNLNESCPRYWPMQASATYGPFNVELTNTQIAPHVTEREFRLTNTFNQKKTTVRQFQLTTYTDDGASAPLTSHEHVYQLWNEVHKWGNRSNTEAPIIVHCESGAGLSGVFCAVDMALDRSEVEQAVDVFQAVRMLRHHRPEMVCTEDQYKLCYQVVQKHIETTTVYDTVST